MHVFDSFDDKSLILELLNGMRGLQRSRFWQMTADNPDATYACVNYGEAICPEDIREQAICIDGDIGTVIDELRK